MLLPHVVAETSNLVRQIAHPAKKFIQETFKKLIETTFEFPVSSLSAVLREEFPQFGVTDSALLFLCEMDMNGVAPTLLTLDGDLANRAISLGYSIINYRQFID